MNDTNEYQEYPNVNRTYKDTVFRMSFCKKEDLLSLYNAINETDYKNPDELEIATLDNAIYLSMKNDVAFLLDCSMNLYEHQSTYNPNMPLRGFLYFARMFEKYITSRKLNIYSSSLQKLPTPRYIVFYNGTKEQPDKLSLRLSDAFLQKDGCLECEVLMLNINHGRNRNLMEKCKRLEEYAYFIDRVRSRFSDGKNLKEAINQSMDECIQQNKLKDILTEQRAEVLGVLLSTFDKELYEKDLKEDAFNRGLSQGLNQGRTEGRMAALKELVQKKLAKEKTIEEIADELEESVETIKAIMG